MELMVCRDTPRAWPSSACDISWRSRSSRTRFVTMTRMLDAREGVKRACQSGRGGVKTRSRPLCGAADRPVPSRVLSYFQAIVIGLIQGVTELFPISSLGHSVLIPAWLGWDKIVGAQSASESFYLAFVVALHVATALALLWYFRADWVRLVRGFVRTLRSRKLAPPDEVSARLLTVATIPAGLTGLALEHALRTLFAKPLSAAIFLTLNGVILFAGESVRRRASVRALVADHPVAESDAEV